MAILGVASAVFGVDDVDRCVRFWGDFGLTLESSIDGEYVFRLPSGSTIIVMHQDDPRLPPRAFEGNGVRLTVWGVDTVEALAATVAKLETLLPVSHNADGSVQFQAPDGQHIALRLWDKRRVMSRPDAINSPDNINRLNTMRQWRHKAIPKTINHVVFFSPDYVSSWEFYRDYLGFRYSDHSRGLGVFARADGTNEHHSIFWVNADLPFVRDGFAFMHIAFGMDDIDEVMLGANIMEAKGWKNTSVNSSQNLSRHRISSAIYYYVDNPSGGEAEYHCDTDYLDDNWVPRAWDLKFGALLWSVNAPPFFRDPEVSWDMVFDPDEISLEPFRKGKPNPVQPELDQLTKEDEHAI
jgi:catechol 2,3-dioxygenase-like lactoylglutathione lyase family enzyme